MFYFFVARVCHAKRDFRNSGLTDKETFRKHQNIIGNVYFFFLIAFLYIWNRSDHDEVDVTILAQLNLLALKRCTYVKQDQFI